MGMSNTKAAAIALALTALFYFLVFKLITFPGGGW